MDSELSGPKIWGVTWDELKEKFLEKFFSPAKTHTYIQALSNFNNF